MIDVAIRNGICKDEGAAGRDHAGEAGRRYVMMIFLGCGNSGPKPRVYMSGS